jgi:acyl carrier protein
MNETLLHGAGTSENIATAIRGFLASTFYVASAEMPSDDASLLENGVIDSTGVLEIIGFLEQTFGFRVEDEEIVPANLDTVRCITDYVLSKTVRP